MQYYMYEHFDVYEVRKHYSELTLGNSHLYNNNCNNFTENQDL